jgi:uncharacterized protein (DUF1015 family)
MACIHPFAALRPAPAVAREVAAVPYDVVSTDEARALAAGNPLSFLHVSRPEIDLPAGTDPHSAPVYEQAVRAFASLRRQAPLVVEDSPSFYVYRLHMGTHRQAGIAACFSIDEYDAGIIRKHEKTRPDKEDDRTRHMLAIRAQTGPVFLTYEASPAVDVIVEDAMNGAPLVDFVAVDGIRHVLWRVRAEQNAGIESAFAAIPALYIADGHHRAASAARARRQLAAGGAGEHDRVLAVAFPDSQMRVLPYNRVVRDLHGHSPSALLDAIRGRADVRPGGPAAPARKGETAMLLDGAWHTITWRPHAQASRGAVLDVDRLQTEVLEPLLGIADVRTDKRIDFVGGIRGTSELERLVSGGAYAVAFSLFPVSVADLMRVSDAGGIMPPKSTWFEPKLRDGLLSHLI